jgi:hypothetical protein
LFGLLHTFSRTAKTSNTSTRVYGMGWQGRGLEVDARRG